MAAGGLQAMILSRNRCRRMRSEELTEKAQSCRCKAHGDQITSSPRVNLPGQHQNPQHPGLQHFVFLKGKDTDHIAFMSTWKCDLSCTHQHTGLLGKFCWLLRTHNTQWNGLFHDTRKKTFLFSGYYLDIFWHLLSDVSLSCMQGKKQKFFLDLQSSQSDAKFISVLIPAMFNHLYLTLFPAFLIKCFHHCMMYTNFKNIVFHRGTELLKNGELRSMILQTDIQNIFWIITNICFLSAHLSAKKGG